MGTMAAVHIQLNAKEFTRKVNSKVKNFSASNPSQGIKKHKLARHFNLSFAYPHMKFIYF